MTTFLKLAAAVTGDEIALLERSTPLSRKKVKALAVALLVPVIIWGGAVFIFTTRVMQASTPVGIVAAVLVALLVFTLERLIIMARGNLLLRVFRVAIGLCMALLGAVIIDDVLFADAIDEQMKLVQADYAHEAGKRAATAFGQRNGVEAHTLAVEAAFATWRAAEQQVASEADGTGGSGVRGVDAVTAVKQRQAQALRQQYESSKSDLEAMQQQSAQVALEATTTAAENFNPHNLLFRIKALFQLVASDGMMLAVYILFTTLMFLMEFLVIIFKSTWQKTAYEYELEKREWLHQQRTDRIYGVNSPELKPHVYHAAAAPISRSLGAQLNTLL